MSGAATSLGAIPVVNSYMITNAPLVTATANQSIFNLLSNVSSSTPFSTVCITRVGGGGTFTLTGVGLFGNAISEVLTAVSNTVYSVNLYASITNVTIANAGNYSYGTSIGWVALPLDFTSNAGTINVTASSTSSSGNISFNADLVPVVSGGSQPLGASLLSFNQYGQITGITTPSAPPAAGYYSMGNGSLTLNSAGSAIGAVAASAYFSPAAGEPAVTFAIGDGYISVSPYGVVTAIKSPTNIAPPAAAGTVTSVTLTSLNNTLLLDGVTITQDGVYNIDLNPTGVSPGQYTIGTALVEVDAWGRVLQINSGSFQGVTSVGVVSNYFNLSGAPITSRGTISINMPLQEDLISRPNTVGVSIANPTITLNEFGLVTAVTAGSETSGTVTAVGLTSPLGSLNVSAYAVTTSGNLTADLPIVLPNISSTQFINPTLTLNQFGQVTSIIDGANNQITSVRINSSFSTVSLSAAAISDGLLTLTLQSPIQSNFSPNLLTPLATVTANQYGIVTSVSQTPINSVTLQNSVTSSGALDIDLFTQDNLESAFIGVPLSPMTSYTLDKYGLVNSASSCSIGFSNNGGGVTTSASANSSGVNLSIAFAQPFSSYTTASLATVSVNEFGFVQSLIQSPVLWPSPAESTNTTMFVGSLTVTPQGLVASAVTTASQPISALTSIGTGTVAAPSNPTISITQNTSVTGNNSWNIDLVVQPNVAPGIYNGFTVSEYGTITSTAGVSSSNSWILWAGYVPVSAATQPSTVNIPGLSYIPAECLAVYSTQIGYAGGGNDSSLVPSSNYTVNGDEISFLGSCWGNFTSSYLNGAYVQYSPPSQPGGSNHLVPGLYGGAYISPTGITTLTCPSLYPVWGTSSPSQDTKSNDSIQASVTVPNMTAESIIVVTSTTCNTGPGADPPKKVSYFTAGGMVITSTGFDYTWAISSNDAADIQQIGVELVYAVFNPIASCQTCAAKKNKTKVLKKPKKKVKK